MKRFFDYALRVLAKYLEPRLQDLRVRNVQKEKEKLFQSFQVVGSNCTLDGSAWHIQESYGLALGNNVFIGDQVNFSCAGGIFIEDNTIISREVMIQTTSPNFEGIRLPYDHKRKHGRVDIGPNVWIGMRVQILPGVKIGEGAIIESGVIVSENVAPFAIVRNAQPVKEGLRAADHYHRLKEHGEFANAEGLPYIQPKQSASLLSFFGTHVFVLSTGRSGSNTIANTFAADPSIDSNHESFSTLVNLSTRYAHREVDAGEVKALMLKLFKLRQINKDRKIYLESDQRLWNLIPIIQELIPNAKFIFLLRDGKDFVRSAVARNWYIDDEFSKNRHRWAEFRLNGFKCGDVDEQTWQGWTALERCSWYWAFLNASIESALKGIAKENQLFVRTKELDQCLEEIGTFIGVDTAALEVVITNQLKAKHQANYQRVQKEFNEEAFSKIAGEIYSRLC